MKKAKYLLFLLPLLIATPVLAVDSTNSGKPVNYYVTNASGSASPTTPATTTGTFFNLDEIKNLIKEASNSANKSALQLQNIIKAADEMITNRISTLNTLNSRIQSDERLTADEKTSLSGSVQNAITGLNTLKTTIDADTDVTKARTDTKSIVTNYYVYASLEPKIRLLISLNNLQSVSTNLSGLSAQVQTLINSFQTQGKDTSGLQSRLNDINAQLQTINSTIATNITTVNGIQPGLNNQQAFSTVRTAITGIVQTDFGQIRTDFSQMRQLFKSLIEGNATPSATPVATTSATTH